MATSVPYHLPPRERRLFVEQFEKDLRFFQLFFLLINKSCPIKKIDLVWAEDPVRRVGLRRLMGTVDALTSPTSRLLQTSESPDPPFCNIVNDCGRRTVESCGISDSAAEQRARTSGKAQVYTCDAGLIDIAVPVICNGEHLATLLTGQVLRNVPTRAGLVQILKNIEHLSYIDRGELSKAYWEVPVVSDEQIRNAIAVLEVFAEYLASSWTRLAAAVRDQVRKDRELQLCRKEFADLVLAGEIAERPRVRELMARIGLKYFPNRVLVVKLEAETEYQLPGRSFDLAFTAAVNAIEELCDKLENISYAYLRKRGLCIFFSDAGGRSTGSAELRAHALGREVLNAIADSGDIRAQVGIGGSKRKWHDLADSYHEACMALAESAEPLATYKKPPASLEALSVCTENLSRLISGRQWNDASVTFRSLPLLVNEYLGDKSQSLQEQRHYFASVLDTMCFTCSKLGCDNAAVIRLRTEGNNRLVRATCIFNLQEAFLESADNVIDEARRLFSNRREKIVDHVQRLVERSLSDRSGAQEIAISALASALGVSAGHLSRTFKQAMGMTLERYIMVRRVGLAKRLLLAPTANVAEVSERCGFSDPTYFSRVFKQVAGCPPSALRANPGAFAADMDGAGPVANPVSRSTEVRADRDAEE